MNHTAAEVRSAGKTKHKSNMLTHPYSLAEKKLLFATRRTFQFWSYIVSHRQLLLRSPKSEEWPTRVDILFKDVSLMCMGTRFKDLSVHEIDLCSSDLPIDISRIPSGHKLFCLSTDTAVEYIAAAMFQSFEDDKEYYDHSVLVEVEHL